MQGSRTLTRPEWVLSTSSTGVHHQQEKRFNVKKGWMNPLIQSEMFVLSGMFLFVKAFKKFDLGIPLVFPFHL